VLVSATGANDIAAMSRLSILVLALVLAFGPGLAAKPAPDAAVPSAREEGQADPLVKRIQQGLAEAGLYLGPTNGILDLETETAIRAFQKRSGQTPDARVTEQLALQIESGQKIQQLLNRLDQVRARHVEQARSALMSREATRKLLEAPPDETADPTRDPKPCFRAPSPECLLREAAETAKTIPTEDLRDWARGEILVSQARAGLIPEAMDTARRIRDPRLILVALRDIAEGQAAAGLASEAIEAAEAIPDSMKRTEALAAIAELEAKRGMMDGARASAGRVLSLLGEVEDGQKRVDLRARMAVVLHRVGDGEAGDAALGEAESEARRETEAAARTVVLRHVARAKAETGRTEDAERILAEIEAEADRVPVLMALVGQYAKAGRFEAARKLADRIAEARYRTVALAQVAASLAGTGRADEVRDLLAAAEALFKDITLPFARDYAVGQVATAWSKLGARLAKDSARGAEAFQEAEKAIRRISDDRLKAHMLWTLAAERRRAGDLAGAKATETQARDGTIDVRSSLTRVWLHGDVALERLADGEPEAAAVAFGRGLEEAEPLDNAWGRARALAKLASTLADLRRGGVAVAGRP
jgi:hypothetical protein